MDCNIGNNNRKLRVIFGMIMFITSFLLYSSGVKGFFFIASLALAILLFLQAGLGFCVIHGLMGTRDLN